MVGGDERYVVKAWEDPCSPWLRVRRCIVRKSVSGAPSVIFEGTYGVSPLT
jgi:hypothetical protein